MSKRLREIEDASPLPSRFLAYRLISYPLHYLFAKRIWTKSLGKLYLRFLRMCRLLIPVLTDEEKNGWQPTIHRIPNGCATLALEQLDAIGYFNEHRRTVQQLYISCANKEQWSYATDILRSTAPQKFPLFHPDAEQIRQSLKEHDIYLDDGWCNAAVLPSSYHHERSGYIDGSCPVVEEVAQTILTLPTHPTTSVTDAERVCEILLDVVRGGED